MAENDRTRMREREPLEDFPYERILRGRQETAQRNELGPIVVKTEKRKVFLSRQGRLRHILEPVCYPETPLQMWRVFTHEVRTVSGKHRHQGGLVIYVLEGKGYSVVDGERWDWEKGDLVLLPMRPEGTEHQHFNLLGPDQPALWMAFIHLPISDYVATETKQVENSPEFKS